MPRKLAAIAKPTEHRRSPRRRVLKKAMLLFRGSGMKCVIRDVSKGGANLDVASSIGIPLFVDLVVVPGRVARPCYVMWRMKTRIGVAFTANPPAD